MAGTAATPTYFGEFTAEGSTPTLKTTVIYSGGERAARRILPVGWSVKGDLTCYVSANTIGELLLLTMGGTDAVTGTSAPYTHTLALATGDIPWFTVQRNFAMASFAENMIDCKMNTLALSGKSEAEITAKLDWMARTDYSGASATTATYDSATEAAYWQGVVTVTVGDVAKTLTVTDWDIEINNQLDQVFGAGQINPAIILPKVRKVTGKCTGSVEAFADLYVPVYGLQASANPTGTLATGKFEVAITTGANTEIDLKLNQIGYESAVPKLSPDGKLLEYPIGFTAYESSSGNDEISAIITNAAVTPF